MCFNEDQLAKHNGSRADHKDTDPLKPDQEAATALQKFLDALTDA
jgi:hypothetical protein